MNSFRLGLCYTILWFLRLILFAFFVQFFTRFLAIVFTAAVAVYYLIPIIILLVIFFVIFRWYFLKTVREIKRLESLGMYIAMYMF